MLKVIIEKEIRDILGSSKFVYTFIVCAVLILLSFYTGAINYKQNIAHWEMAQAENLNSFEGMTDWLRVRENRIFLDPQPLAALVNGVSNDIGRTSNIETRGEIHPEDSRYNEEPVYAYFRFIDLEFIFSVVLALFAILLGYDAICGEKESGTLKLCLSNAVPRTKLLLGKFVGSFTILSASLLLVIAIGTLLLPLLGVHLSSSEWIRFGLIILAGLLYFGVFLALSIMVSSITQKTSTSFLVLLIVWIGSTLILPRAAVLIAGRAVDVPTVDEIGYQKAAYATERWKEHIAAIKDFQVPPVDPEDPEGMSSMMNAFNKFMDSLGQVREDKLAEYYGRLNEDRHNHENVRSKVAFALSRISPSASLSLATSTLAGTSTRLKDRFYEQSNNYQNSFIEFLNEKTGMNLRGGMIFISDDADDTEKEPIDAGEIPTYEYQPPPLKDTLNDALPDIGLLALFNIIFIAGAFVAFNRYDAR